MTIFLCINTVPPLLIRSKSICWIPAMSSVTPTETAGGTANSIGLDDEIESAVNLPQLKGTLAMRISQATPIERPTE